MDTSLYVSLSGQVALRRELQVIAHNLANMNTTAFRAERSLFDTALSRANRDNPVSFVIDRATYTDVTAGTMSQTGRPLDIALRGPGWFQVEAEDGSVRYSRDGRLTLSTDGFLINVHGGVILDDGGAAIPLPPETERIDIGRDGTLTADGQLIGRIGLYEFDNVSMLEREANSLYKAPGNVAPLPAFETSIVQGALEGSNVRPILEMTRMIELARAYENSSRTATDGHELKKDSISRLGRPSS